MVLSVPLPQTPDNHLDPAGLKERAASPSRPRPPRKVLTSLTARAAHGLGRHSTRQKQVPARLCAVLLTQYKPERVGPRHGAGGSNMRQPQTGSLPRTAGSAGSRVCLEGVRLPDEHRAAGFIVRRSAPWPQILGTDSEIFPTTCFSSEDGWRGACASRRRDRRLRLLQALVSCSYVAKYVSTNARGRTTVTPA